MNDNKILYSTDGKKWKKFGEIKDIGFVKTPVEHNEEFHSLKLNEPYHVELECKFSFSREVSRSLHFIHSKKLRTRKKHAKKLLRILAGIAR